MALLTTYITDYKFRAMGTRWLYNAFATVFTQAELQSTYKSKALTKVQEVSPKASKAMAKVSEALTNATEASTRSRTLS